VILEWVPSRYSEANPSSRFGTDNHPARPAQAAVGSLHAATYATGPMTRLGFGEKLNHERGMRPLAV
jgi:hypothetical protein